MNKPELLKSGFVAMGILLAINLSKCSSFTEKDSKKMGVFNI